MSRPFTPSAILDARGSFIHHPESKRPDEPTTSKPLGAPPKWMLAAEKTVWNDLAKQCLPGVLMYSDRAAFEMLVCLATTFRARGRMSQGDKTLMLTLLARFGLTPSDRARVHVPAPVESKLAKFLRERPATAPTPEYLAQCRAAAKVQVQKYKGGSYPSPRQLDANRLKNGSS